MVRKTARFFIIFGFANFCSAMAFQDELNDETRHEALMNVLSIVKDDRVSLSNALDPTFVPEKEVFFHLFTKENIDESYILKAGNADNLEKSNFNPARVTKIIVHGWTDSINSYWVKDTRNNYLNAGDYNVILVDWYLGCTKEYLVSAGLTQQVGEYLGYFLEYLKTEGNLSFDDVHILGHSLGAHIAGYAGKFLSSKIRRITGLDPARPAFEVPILKEQNYRLDPSDAKFVDVIHTCAGTAGFSTAIGHVDFYPNGGTFTQPGCSTHLTQYCSHGRSHQFMTESIAGTTKFIGVNCDSWTKYKSGRCVGNIMATMGEHINEESRGKYFLKTNAESPFARGTLDIDFQT